MTDSSLKQLDLPQVIDNCKQESANRSQRDLGHCLELFRRALDDGIDFAWQAIDMQYRSLVCSWVHRSKMNDLDPEEVNDVASDAFVKFWRTLSKKIRPISDNFTHIGGVLNYLRNCTSSVVHERHRVQQKQIRVQNAIQQKSLLLNQHSSLKSELEQDERITAIHRWVSTHVTEANEKLVLSLSFEYELTPREIAAEHPEIFKNAREVTNVKARILKRAKRALLN